jgi:hypothetical protein
MAQMPTYLVGFNSDCFGRILILTAAAISRKPDQAQAGFRNRTVSLGR